MPLIRIVFKSGHIQDVAFEEFSLKKGIAGIHSIQWKNSMPRLMHVNIDEIAAVIELDVSPLDVSPAAQTTA